MADLPRFLTLPDVAEILNTSVAQVYAMVRRGDLPAIKIGGRGQWRVSEPDLEDYIAQQRIETRKFIDDHPFDPAEADAGGRRELTSPACPRQCSSVHRDATQPRAHEFEGRRSSSRGPGTDPRGSWPSPADERAGRDARRLAMPHADRRRHLPGFEFANSSQLHPVRLGVDRERTAYAT